MKKKIAKNTVQQGDVVAKRLVSMPEGEQKIVVRKLIVVAHGESGHAHIVEDDEAELICIGERMLLKLGKEATIQHEEHKPVTLSPGIWEVGRVQEYDWLKQMQRPVQD